MFKPSAFLAKTVFCFVLFSSVLIMAEPVWAATPGITFLNPQQGPTSGGTNVTINGSSFEQNKEILLQSTLANSATITVNSLTLDGSGNMYIGGFTDGSVTFGSDTLATSGSNDPILAKFNSQGVAVWGRKGGGTSNDSSNDSVADASGNSWSTGSFGATASWNGQTLVSSGSSDIFLAKYDADGNIQWAKRGGSTSVDLSQGVAVDTNGNSYITGTFSGTATFGSQSLVTAGSTDAFTIKYDSNGNVVWAKKGGGTGSDSGRGITVDAQGNVYVAGTFSGTASFGSESVDSAGNTDVYIMKYDSNGNVLWLRKGGGTGADQPNRVELDSHNNLYTIGIFPAGTITFGSENLDSAGSNDVFLVKYSETGTLLWARRGGGTGSDAGNDLAVDREDNPYITGGFTTQAGFGSLTVTGAGSSDPYVARYNSAGEVTWISIGLGTGFDAGRALRVANDGTVVGIGTYNTSGAGPTNVAFGSLTTTTSSVQAMYILKYGQLSTTIGGNQCTSLRYLSSSQLSCNTPAGSRGFASVVVRNPGGETFTKTEGFEYIIDGQQSGSAPTQCTYFSPVGKPDLFQIQTTDTSATLWFTPIGKPHNHYLITYGPKEQPELYSQQLEYHDFDAVISTKIFDLTPNTSYTFRVRGGNNCAAGEWSDVFTVKTTALRSAFPLTFYSHFPSTVEL